MALKNGQLKFMNILHLYQFDGSFWLVKKKKSLTYVLANFSVLCNLDVLSAFTFGQLSKAKREI